MKDPQQAEAVEAVRSAVSYLGACGIQVPRFKLTTIKPNNWSGCGGSYVDGCGGRLRLNMGRFPSAFLRNWFAMHELGHVLWSVHQPLRRKQFRSEFGEPTPHDYDSLHQSESWKTAVTWKFSWLAGPHRTKGEPSWYGKLAGGEERFCELIGFLYAHGDFSKKPPADLAGLWDCCWEHGLSRMT